MMLTPAFTRVADVLRREIEQELISIGLLCRVFGRGKSPHSLIRKVESTPNKYGIGKKLIQDAVGIRVVVYFPEDVQIAETVLKVKYQCDETSSTIDKPTDTFFSVSRYNLVFQLPQIFHRDVPEPTEVSPIDRSFEVQIRTILSEGWHEVEHDLRYKRKADWIGHDDMSRGLNGVVATLETAEWSMRKIFDDLAYKHYKSRRWDAMLHTALRMRITAPLGQNICGLLDSDREMARRLVRIRRADVFYFLFKLAPRIPLIADNIIFIWNHMSLKNADVTKLTPQFILETIEASSL